MARPKSSQAPKNKLITVRLNETEHTQITQNAAAARLTISEFSRRCILGRRINFVARCDQEAVNGLFSAIGEMKKVGGLLKHSIEVSRGKLKYNDIEKVLNQLKKTIENVGDTVQKITR
ncbi:plasmid mobilization protein [Jonquetella anthropi]|uniref:plasmid mobilization protein n=1 Tax=Jonquetella anthropi TaxID=428712 RepID=UPI0001B911F9|nr:hypothetical protein [Jonquetella anthropi]EEX47861.1 hypothetical protein GCWU000246_01575 [Jonquetella anthropi E3_33 E1]